MFGLLPEHSVGCLIRKGYFMPERIYNVGQVLTAQKDIELEGALGTKRIIKKGTKIYIGADNFAHHRDGTIQPLEKNADVKGYSVSGLAEFIWLYIRNNTPVDEYLLEEYDETSDCIKEAIMNALEELGMYDHTGNRS